MTTTETIEPGYSEAIQNGVTIEQDIDTRLLDPQPTPAQQPEPPESLGDIMVEAGQTLFLGLGLMICLISLFHPWWQ